MNRSTLFTCVISGGINGPAYTDHPLISAGEDGVFGTEDDISIPGGH